MERSLSLVEESIFYGIDLVGAGEYYKVAKELPKDEPRKGLNEFLDEFFEKNRRIKMRLRVYAPSLEDDWVSLSRALSGYVLTSYRFAFPDSVTKLREHLDTIGKYIGDEFLSKEAVDDLCSSYNEKNG